ncbi:hypothetical protein EDEG_00221 [Edhazardia aedis USNM 41457]|uniref:Uncharacterized protein n=1 Tax=Edhazardia aedis (strain USNM 41457) TaxID=1003232 RepID=J9DPM9_EDHAE|nr:hypothetical protein EDEG_00221 [Edhazardia aedis USNM 41457]|eukprot:EJW03312.1 hypothetical protein EDEG_00221 [Edhazardia aedis USNM 41457]
MQKDFDKFDAMKKGYLTYKEYKLLSLTHFIKPQPEHIMSDAIFLQDIVRIDDMVLHEKDDVHNEYQSLFKALSENGSITYLSLKNICQKIGLNVTDHEIEEMLKLFDNKGDELDFEQFLRILKY